MQINYSLKILKESKEYNPNSLIINPIVKSSDKIFEIKASNGYGKTFLLNLVALALKGDELKESKDTIKETLKDTISRYKNSSYYDLNYDLSFDLPDGKELISSKNNDDVTVFIKDKNSTILGSNYGANTLHKDLTILYDVPSDPAERLNGVLANLTNWNNKIFTTVQKQLDILFELERNTNFSRDETKIIEFSKKVEEADKSILKIKEAKEKKQNLLDKLTEVSYLKQLLAEFRSNLDLETNQKYDFDRLSKIKKPVKVQIKDESKLKIFQDRKKQLINDFKQKIVAIFRIVEYSEVNKIILENTGLKGSVDIQFIDFNKIPEFDVEEINNLKQKILRLTSEVLDILKSEKSKPQNKLVEDYKAFVDFLENINSEIFSEIVKTQKDVILKIVLEKLNQIKPTNTFESEIAFLKSCENSISDLLAEIFKVQKFILEEQKKSSNKDSSEDEYNNAFEKFKDSKEKFESSNSRIVRIKSFLLQLNVAEVHLKNKESVNSLLSIVQSSPQLRPLVINLENSIDEIKRDIQSYIIQESELDEQLKINVYKLGEEKKKSPEILNNHQKVKLKDLIRIVTGAKMLLSHYDELSKITKTKISDFNKRDEELIFKKFFSIAGNIIAQSMENKIIRSDGQFETFQSVDLLKKEYLLDDGRIIKQEDISTGQSSGNYLKQRILNLEGKYIVILLDEIGNMDQSVLKEVIDAIKVIQNQKRLVLALLAQPGNEGINVIAY